MLAYRRFSRSFVKNTRFEPILNFLIALKARITRLLGAIDTWLSPNFGVLLRL